jgi:hypothetical protein
VALSMWLWTSELGQRRNGVPRVRLWLGLSGLLSVPALVSAASVDVAAWKDLPFCRKVATFMGERFTPVAELSKTVDWKPVELKGQEPKMRRCSSLDKAFLDLDNDGANDLVVKTTFCMKGAPSDSLYVFPADSNVLEQLSWQDLAPLLATRDKFERTGGRYPLSGLPMSSESAQGNPALSMVFTVQPFILEHRSYVAMTDSRGTWTVIAKYLRGERFEDQCYLWTKPS